MRRTKRQRSDWIGVASLLSAGPEGHDDMGKGIVGMITQLGTVAIAATIGMMGLDFVFRGQRLLGGGFVAFAVLMVLVEEYITTPDDVAGDLAASVVGTVAKEPESESDSERND
jgi:hypothetical protein